MVDQRIESARHDREGELEHDLLAFGQLVQILEDFLKHDCITFGARRALDVNFRLQHRHHAMRQHLLAHFKLLLHDRGNAFAIGRVDDGTLLRAEYAQRAGAGQQCVKFGHRLHQLDTVHLVFQTLVDLDEGHDALFDQRRRGRLAVHLTIHRAFKQDRTDHLVARESGGGNDPAAHLVNEAEHLLFTGPCGFLDPVAFQCLGGRTAALVQCGHKAVTVREFLEHILMLHVPACLCA